MTDSSNDTEQTEFRVIVQSNSVTADQITRVLSLGGMRDGTFEVQQ